MKRPSGAYRAWAKRQDRLAAKAKEYEREVAALREPAPTHDPHGSWVIRREGDGHYVLPPGLERSYTARLQLARRFPTRAAAQAECCGNEYPFKA